MFSNSEILETVNMVREEHFDVRTITMGISLLDCIRSDAQGTADAVYSKICRLAANLVKTGCDLSAEYGVPIVNKRISVTPASLLTANFPGEEMTLALALDRAAKEMGVDFLGGYSALVHKGIEARKVIYLYAGKSHIYCGFQHFVKGKSRPASC